MKAGTNGLQLPRSISRRLGNALWSRIPRLKRHFTHCQQAAEKIVKAALIDLGIAPPRIHDVGALLDRLPDGHPLLGSMRDLEWLTVFGLAYRYPADETVSNPPLPSISEIHGLIDRMEMTAAALRRG